MLQTAHPHERFRGMTIPAGFEAAIVAAEAERHGCDVVPDVTSRQVKGHRGLFTSYLVRTTTLYVNGRLCLLKRAKVPADTPEGARRYAHFDFRTNRFKDKEFVVLRIECGDSSSFYILTMSELLEWYGEDAARISLGIPVPEYPIAYCHAGFDWAACKNAWHIIRPLS